MKISLVSASVGGGAGKAAWRLHNGLLRQNVGSTLYVKETPKQATAGVVAIHSPEVRNGLLEHAVNGKLRQLIQPGNTLCSAMYPSAGFSFLDEIAKGELINLHWISGFISSEAIAYLAALGKPIVWTLHDQNPFTGVCHYSGGCDGYLAACAACPQMPEEKRTLPAALWAVKKKYLPLTDMTIVAPSRWMGECARNSALFQQCRVEVISNGLDLGIYAPVSQAEARQRLQLPLHEKIVLFGAHDLQERRKGSLELLAAMKELAKREGYASSLRVLTFGHQTDLLAELPLACSTLGYVEDESVLRDAYAAADVVVVPSLEDNLPNLMVESVAVGTPVAAFDVGGVSDVVVPGKTGFLARPGDVSALASAIQEAIYAPSLRETCRAWAKAHLAEERQAQAYQKLFAELLAEKGSDSRQYFFPPVMAPEAGALFADWLCDAAVEVQKDLEYVQQAHKEAQEACAWLEQEKGRLEEEKDWQENELEQLRHIVVQRDENIEQLSYELHKVRSSLSWQLTKPFRVVGRCLKKIVKYMLPYYIVQKYQQRK